MENCIDSFSLRVLTLSDYRTPLYTHVLDSDQRNQEIPLADLAKDIALASKTHVITQEKWEVISNIAESILQKDELWKMLSHRDPYRVASINSSWRVYRKTLIKQIRLTRELPSNLAYEAIANSLYQSSEGLPLPLDYTVSPSSLTWFNETLSGQVINFIEKNRNNLQLKELERDDVVAWLRLLYLIQNNPTRKFKSQFKEALGYEIPFGLSPKSKSETLEALIKNSKTIALVPMLSGINTVSTALTTGEWLVALEAATATGAVVVVLISSIAISDRIVNYLKTRKK